MSDPLALRAAQEAILASGSSLARPGGLCGPCVELLPVTGAAVSTLSGPINNETVCASDDVAFRIDELQFDLGEGPCWEAFASRRPVLVPDLRDGPPFAPWPVFSTAVRETSAAALFAFPLYVGGTGIGALDLYRSTAGPLDEEALRDARILADTVAIEVMRRILAAVAQEAEGTSGQARPRPESGDGSLAGITAQPARNPPSDGNDHGSARPHGRSRFCPAACARVRHGQLGRRSGPRHREPQTAVPE